MSDWKKPTGPVGGPLPQQAPNGRGLTIIGYSAVPGDPDDESERVTRWYPVAILSDGSECTPSGCGHGFVYFHYAVEHAAQYVEMTDTGPVCRCTWLGTPLEGIS